MAVLALLKPLSIARQYLPCTTCSVLILCAVQGGVVAGLGSAGVMFGAVGAASDLMQDFRTGYLTLASPKVGSLLLRVLLTLILIILISNSSSNNACQPVTVRVEQVRAGHADLF